MTTTDLSIIGNGIFTGTAYKLFWSGFTWGQAFGIAATQAAVCAVADRVLENVDSWLLHTGVTLTLQVGAVFGVNHLLQGGLLPVAMTTGRLAWIIFSTPLFTACVFLGVVALGAGAWYALGCAASQPGRSRV